MKWITQEEHQCNRNNNNLTYNNYKNIGIKEPPHVWRYFSFLPCVTVCFIHRWIIIRMEWGNGCPFDESTTSFHLLLSFRSGDILPKHVSRLLSFFRPFQMDITSNNRDGEQIVDDADLFHIAVGQVGIRETFSSRAEPGRAFKILRLRYTFLKCM